MAAKTPKEYVGIGRRKTAVARVRLLNGAGNMVINKKTLKDYFGRDVLQLSVQEPFKATDTEGQFDVFANINGGGTTAQVGALCHGIARALVAMNPDFRKPLKSEGLLTRDAREKERRKVGHRKARRSPQYSKR